MIMECSHYRQYMKFLKEVLVVGLGKWAAFYPNFSPAAASQACVFFLSRQMKCKTYGIFKSFF